MTKKNNMIKFKPLLKEFVEYYYKQEGNEVGGCLHIVLDDGNLEPEHIQYCQTYSKDQGDTFGYFLATLMLCFEESELMDLKGEDSWGLSNEEK